MVVRIRLSRFGCKNKPFYRVMAADSRSPRDGKHLEVLGYYNPLPGSLSPSVSELSTRFLFLFFIMLSMEMNVLANLSSFWNVILIVIGLLMRLAAE